MPILSCLLAQLLPMLLLHPQNPGREALHLHVWPCCSVENLSRHLVRLTCRDVLTRCVRRLLAVQCEEPGACFTLAHQCWSNLQIAVLSEQRPASLGNALLWQLVAHDRASFSKAKAHPCLQVNEQQGLPTTVTILSGCSIGALLLLVDTHLDLNLIPSVWLQLAGRTLGLSDGSVRSWYSQLRQCHVIHWHACNRASSSTG